VAVEGASPISARATPKLFSGSRSALDGTDNFETRFLINDVAVKSRRPWIYAAGVASYGLTMTIRPGATACLACLLETGSAAQGLEATCDTIGVLGPIVNLIASLEAAEALNSFPATPRLFTGACFLAMCGPAACNPSAWRAIRMPRLRQARFHLS